MKPFSAIKSLILHCCILVLSFFSFQVKGGEVIHSQVSGKKGVFKAAIEMQIKAPVDKVYALLTDYNQLSRLNDNITNSDLLEEEPPEYTVLIETHNCVLLFCTDLQQTQLVTELGDGYLAVEDIQSQSDFIFANSRWHIRSHKDGTRVTFASEMKPDFWLPPLFGSWLFKTKLIKETKNMIERLEQLANHAQLEKYEKHERQEQHDQ